MGFVLENSTECIYIFVNSQNYQNGLVQISNGHHSWIHIEKQVLKIYNKHLCSAIAIEIYSKQCESVISAIKGNRWDTIAVHDFKQM